MNMYGVCVCVLYMSPTHGKYAARVHRAPYTEMQPIRTSTLREVWILRKRTIGLIHVDAILCSEAECCLVFCPGALNLLEC